MLVYDQNIFSSLSLIQRQALDVFCKKRWSKLISYWSYQRIEEGTIKSFCSVIRRGWYLSLWPDIPVTAKKKLFVILLIIVTKSSVFDVDRGPEYNSSLHWWSLPWRGDGALN